MAAKKRWVIEGLEEEKPWTVRYPVHAAAQGGDLESLKRLLGVATDVKATVNAQDDDSWTPAHYACWYGHTEVVRELLDRGASLTATNNGASTLLHFAAGCGHADIVSLLLSKDRSLLLARNKEKQTPVDLVKQLKPEGWQKVVELLEAPVTN